MLKAGHITDGHDTYGGHQSGSRNMQKLLTMQLNSLHRISNNNEGFQATDG